MQKESTTTPELMLENQLCFTIYACSRELRSYTSLIWIRRINVFAVSGYAGPVGETAMYGQGAG